MKALLNYRPGLRACELEDRLAPAMPDPGVTLLTTGGYVLVMSPFPVIAADPFGASGGPGFLTPPAMTGSGGIASLLPANASGVSGIATLAPLGSNGGSAVTIIVGSGAEDASAPTIPPVTRNTIANDAANAVSVISRGSGDRSAVLPPEQIYRRGVPVPAPAGEKAEVPGQPAGSEPGERPAGPLTIRLRKTPHRLASDASGNLLKSNAERPP